MNNNFDVIFKEYLDANKKAGGDLPFQLMLLSEIRSLRQSLDKLVDFMKDGI